MINAIRIKTICLSQVMHKLPFMTRHRFKSMSHRFTAQKIPENTLYLGTPGSIIVEIVQCTNLISSFDVLGLVEGGSSIDV